MGKRRTCESTLTSSLFPNTSSPLSIAPMALTALISKLSSEGSGRISIASLCFLCCSSTTSKRFLSCLQDTNILANNIRCDNFYPLITHSSYFQVFFNSLTGKRKIAEKVKVLNSRKSPKCTFYV